MSVVTALDVVVWHANLPDYHMSWHKEPMSLWDEWLKPYLGKQLSDPALRRTQPPPWW
eukprot:COSAG01_NODE_1483_length_10158_cov_38.218290_15_plen_58_part_00